MDDMDNPIAEENEIEEIVAETPTPLEAAEPLILETGADTEPELPPVEGEEDFSEPALISEEEPLEPPKPESKVKVFFKKLLRWTVGILIVFGLGLLTGIFVLYRPAAQDAALEIQTRQSELNEAESQIFDYESRVLDLESQVEKLQVLQVKNDELLAAQDGFKLHVALLDARLDIANAQLALSQKDTASARIILDKTANTFNTITSLLAPDQQEAVTSMKQRLELVMSELETDVFAAQSDLNVLATNLLQMEDALFSE